MHLDDPALGRLEREARALQAAVLPALLQLPQHHTGEHTNDFQVGAALSGVQSLRYRRGAE